MNIKWKSIEGFSNYEVSNMGDIRRLGGNGHAKRPSMQLDQAYVQLWHANKPSLHKITTLIAKAFLSPKPGPKWGLFPKDGDKSNFAASNLEWRWRTFSLSDCRRIARRVKAGFSIEHVARSLKLKMSLPRRMERVQEICEFVDSFEAKIE